VEKKAGRPKGKPRKVITIRLDAELHQVLEAFEDLVLETHPSAKVVDIHEAIFHNFFFTYQGRELRSRDASQVLSYLMEYVDSKELRSAERWSFFHTAPAPEEIERYLQAYEERKSAHEAYNDFRLAELEAERQAYNQEQGYAELLRVLKDVQERLEALEKPKKKKGVQV